MRGQGGGAKAAQAEIEAVDEFVGAHHVGDGQLGAASVRFGGKEGVVEGRVVGDEDAAAQQWCQLVGDGVSIVWGTDKCEVAAAMINKFVPTRIVTESLSASCRIFLCPVS